MKMKGGEQRQLKPILPKPGSFFNPFHFKILAFR